MSERMEFAITVREDKDFQFLVDFGGVIPELRTDEASPLGQDAGPNPARLLGAAVANCLAASLLFSLRKFKNHSEPVSAAATVSLARNDDKRWRIDGISVELRIAQSKSEIAQLDRVLSQFEDFCIVTQSVRQGIPVDIRVVDGDKLRLA